MRIQMTVPARAYQVEGNKAAQSRPPHVTMAPPYATQIPSGIAALITRAWRVIGAMPCRRAMFISSWLPRTAISATRRASGKPPQKTTPTATGMAATAKRIRCRLLDIGYWAETRPNRRSRRW
ncbi:MAG: hypothetical protein R2882_03370 [Gemmatimonadales bacterium]